MSEPKNRRYAVITGAASGLGRAMAVRLGREGWHIALADTNADGCRQTAELVNQAGGTTQIASLDVTDPAAWNTLIDQLEAQWPRLDLLVNNAGVACSGEVGSLCLDDWQWTLNINLFGTIHGCHACRDWLVQNPERGHILNVASAAAIVSAPSMGPYNVSKAGVVALSETLYAELRPHGVGVTVLCPGFVPTNLLAEARFARPEQRLTAERLMRASRLSTDDVAKAAIEGVRRGRLYVVLPGRARIFWRLKRLMPTAMMKLVSWVARRDAAITPPQPSNTCPPPLSHSGASTSEARSSSHAKS